MPADSPIVKTAFAVTTVLGWTAESGAGSTDANYPMSLGIPSIDIGGGGRGTDAHALTEAFDTTDSWQGTQRALLLTIALAREVTIRSRSARSTRSTRRIRVLRVLRALRAFVMNTKLDRRASLSSRKRARSTRAGVSTRARASARRARNARCARADRADSRPAAGAASSTGMKFRSVASAKIDDEERIGSAAPRRRGRTPWPCAPIHCRLPDFGL